MAILGLFKKHDLTKLKVQDVKDDQRKLDDIEHQIGRRLTSLQDKMEGLRLYAREEKGLTDSELEQVADQLEELELDVSADYQELNKVRQEKRAVKEIGILL